MAKVSNPNPQAPRTSTTESLPRVDRPQTERTGKQLSRSEKAVIDRTAGKRTGFDRSPTATQFASPFAEQAGVKETGGGGSRGGTVSATGQPNLSVNVNFLQTAAGGTGLVNSTGCSGADACLMVLDRMWKYSEQQMNMQMMMMAFQMSMQNAGGMNGMPQMGAPMYGYPPPGGANGASGYQDPWGGNQGNYPYNPYGTNPYQNPRQTGGTSGSGNPGDTLRNAGNRIANDFINGLTDPLRNGARDLGRNATNAIGGWISNTVSDWWNGGDSGASESGNTEEGLNALEELSGGSSSSSNELSAYQQWQQDNAGEYDVDDSSQYSSYTEEGSDGWWKDDAL